MANAASATVNLQLAGRVYPPAGSYVVGREKIREFARSLGEIAPVFLDVAAAQAAGYPDVVAPPTFPTVLTLRIVEQVISDPDSGLDWDRVVHGEEKYTYHQPICAGDELEVSTTVDSVRMVAGNAMVTLRAEITTIQGQPRVSAKSMLVVRALEQSNANGAPQPSTADGQAA